MKSRVPRDSSSAEPILQLAGTVAAWQLQLQRHIQASSVVICFLFQSSFRISPIASLGPVEASTFKVRSVLTNV